MSYSTDNCEDDLCSTEVGEGAGFLFCFKLRSACTLESESLSNLVVGTFVDVLTWSDIIHVEIVPVRSFDCISGALRVGQSSYTAFMNIGFVKYDSAECCGSPMFTYVYLPLNAETTHRGIQFLESIVGAKYNKKGMWNAFWHQFSYLKRNNNLFENVSIESVVQRGKPVFCSEAALMLLYILNVYSGPERPEFCTPKIIHNILLTLRCQPYTELQRIG